MSSENVLIIFVKYPQAGFVKTRLAKEIGKVKASLLYRLFVETILARTEDAGFTRVIFYSPAHKRKQIKDWLGSNLKLHSQRGDVLGDRLSYAFRFAFLKGAQRVIVIGTDSPALDRRVVLDAFERLKNVQCVLGPAWDGGYYLLGLSSFSREIFKGIEWSSDKVFTQTMELIKKLKIKFSLLDEDFDIDNIDSLLTLWQRLPQIYKINPTALSPLTRFLNKIVFSRFFKYNRL